MEPVEGGGCVCVEGDVPVKNAYASAPASAPAPAPAKLVAAIFLVCVVACGDGNEVASSDGAVDSGADVAPLDEGGGDVGGEQEVAVDADAEPPTTLRAAAETTKRLVGAAGQVPQEAPYEETLGREFDYVTPENSMKWGPIQPSPTTWNFGPPDALVDFAQKHAMKVKGHCLVWYLQLPSWITTSMTASELHAAMIDHVTTEVTHFKGRVYAWDVVNEAIADGGAGPGGASGLRSSVFADKLGVSYIADAFDAAHAADPDALLFYNDYGAEGLGAKSDRVYALVKSLVDAKVPISGVGLQMHIEGWSHPPVADIAANMKRLAALGLKVNISEMDVQMRSLPGALDQQLVEQGKVFHDVVATCVAEPGCHAVTFWGFTDKYSWIPAFTGHPEEKPLLFDASYAKKPAYDGVMNALMGK